MFKTTSPEERAAKLAAKETESARSAAQKEYEEFLASPVGQARTSFERGDRVFQCSHAVASQEAIIVAMVGSNVATTSSDPTEVLNHVCSEGWELINGSFVFVEQGQQSRDKFMTSGQNVAIKGEIVGYYLFRRCESNRIWGSFAGA